MARSLATMVAAFCVLIGAGSAKSAEIAYDGFAYPPGALPGNNGGTGFLGPWNGDAGVTVQGAASLTHPLALLGTGRLLGGGFNENRSLASAIGDSVFWMSFMVQAQPGNDQVWLGVDAGATQFPFITFGRRLNNYFIQSGTNAPVNACCGSAAGVTDLLIVRVTRNAVSTLVDLWVDKNPVFFPPTLSVGLPVSPPLQWVDMQVQPGYLADEVRIGTTPQDVLAASIAPVPISPWATLTTIVISTALGMLFVGRARRNRRVRASD